MGWEARIRCILLISGIYRILSDQQYQHRLIQRLACAALTAPGRGQWMGKLRTCFETLGWHDHSCASLAGVSSRGTTQGDGEKCSVQVCGE